MEKLKGTFLYGGAMPTIQCVHWLFQSYLHEMTKINFQFLNDKILGHSKQFFGSRNFLHFYGVEFPNWDPNWFCHE